MPYRNPNQRALIAFITLIITVVVICAVVIFGLGFGIGYFISTQVVKYLF